MSEAIITERRNNTRLARQAGRFLVIGGMSVAIDLLAYRALTLAGLEVTCSKGLSYVLGMLLGFFGNKYWTFGSRRRSASEPARFVLLYGITLTINMATNAALLHVLGDSYRLVAFVVATGLSTVLNFVGMRVFAFSPQF
jgi:putative flippase GtrA